MEISRQIILKWIIFYLIFFSQYVEIIELLNVEDLLYY